jgi:hypothetical protein
MNNPHIWGRTARNTPPDFRQAWYATLQLRYARIAYAIQGEIINIAWLAFLAFIVVLFAAGSSLWHWLNPGLAARQTEQAPVSRAFLENQWAKFPADAQREYASQMKWDPTSPDTRVFGTVEQNVLEMRRHWTDLTQVQKDTIVTFCHVYGYPYCQ